MNEMRKGAIIYPIINPITAPMSAKKRIFSFGFLEKIPMRTAIMVNSNATITMNIRSMPVPPFYSPIQPKR
jgi:hypothetical protein